MWTVVELGIDIPSGTARARSLGATALDDEVGNDPMEAEPIVETRLGELDEILGMTRRDIVPELDDDRAVSRVDIHLLVSSHCLLLGFHCLFRIEASRSVVRESSWRRPDRR